MSKSGWMIWCVRTLIWRVCISTPVQDEQRFRGQIACPWLKGRGTAHEVPWFCGAGACVGRGTIFPGGRRPKPGAASFGRDYQMPAMSSMPDARDPCVPHFALSQGSPNWE